MAVFGRQSLYQDNPGSPVPPGPQDDVTLGFGVGSSWFVTPTGIFWYCTDATQGAAKWTPIAAGAVLATLIGANMNITTDQPFTSNFDLGSLSYAVSKILVTNASISLTTAVGGIYTAAAKGGTAIVAADQVYSALTSPTSLLSLTITAAGSGSVWSVDPILSLTTPQGAAATADFYLIGDIIPS